jgi:hypothetical protein
MRFQREERLRGERRQDSLAVRVDVRGPTDAITLSREDRLHLDLRYQRDLLLALEPTYERLLDAHLANTPLARSVRGWRYRQALAREFPLPTYWDTAPGLVRAFRAGEEVHCSLREAAEAHRLTIIATHDSLDVSVPELWQEVLAQAARIDAGELVLLGPDLKAMFYELSWSLVHDRKPAEFRLRGGAHAEVIFGSRPDELPAFAARAETDRDSFYLVDFGSPDVLCIALQPVYWYWGPTLLNPRHPFARWIVQLDEARRRGDQRVSEDQFWRLLHLVTGVRRDHTSDKTEALNAFVAAWRQSGALAPDLLPPDAPLSPDEFLDGSRCVGTGRRRRGRK